MAKDTRNTSQITIGKIVVVSVCLCVFVFALQVKLAQYDPPSAGVTPVKAAKLWNGDDRLQLPNPTELPSLPLLILPFLLVFALFQVSGPQTLATIQVAPRIHLLLWQEPLFFRPPPAR